MRKALKSIISETLGIEITRKSRLQTRRFDSYASALSACTNSAGYEFSNLVDLVFEKTKIYAKALEAEVTQLNHAQSIAMNILHELARKRDAISVVDFGGACGAHYLLARKLLPSRVTLQWHVVETPLMSRKAQALGNSELKFYASMANAAKDLDSAGLSLALTSSTLQYTDAPFVYLRQMLDLKAEYAAFLRSNLTTSEHDEIYIQRSRLSENGIGPFPPGLVDCEISYPLTSMQKDKFQQAILSSGYRQLFAFEDASAYLQNAQQGFAGLFARV